MRNHEPQSGQFFPKIRAFFSVFYNRVGEISTLPPLVAPLICEAAIMLLTRFSSLTRLLLVINQFIKN